jgi:CRISPR-associated endonuclease Cas2
MALTPSRWIVSYDITEDGVRRAVAGILSGYGQRALYSVFDLPVAAGHAHRAFDAAVARCRRGDAMLMSPLCARCVEVEHGRPVEAGPGNGWLA